jgi:uncharacterized protein (DUF2236 family)
MAVADDHYFPPGRSVLRRVHGERAVGLLYGQRALLIGALDPLTYTGTMLSTSAGEYPFRRLAHTGMVQETIMLGTKAEADEALAAVHRLHDRVMGELPEPAGNLPAGTPYSAYDPASMLWTLACIADSGQMMYETMVRSLSDEEREDLWQDYLRFGELFGMRRDAAPASHSEFRAWWRERMESDELEATEHALEVAPVVAFEQPVPLRMAPGIKVNNLVIKGTLPPRVREIFRIAWTPAHQAAFEAITQASRRTRRFVPRRIRRGRNDATFEMVIRTERERGGTAGPPPPGSERLAA